MLEILLLGQFIVTYDKVAITENFSSRLQSLLAYLLLNADAPQNRSHLAFLFWPDTSEKQAHTNLRNLLHQLRQILPSAESYIKSTIHTIQWQTTSAYSLDVDEFKTCMSLADKDSQGFDLIETQAAYEKALEIYKGDLIPSCYDDWIFPFRENLRKKFINAIGSLIALLESKRDYSSAVQYAHRLLQYDNLNETTYQILMRLHALNNNRAGALRIYHECETVLKRELGIKPGPITQEAYENLLGEGRKTKTSIYSETKAFMPIIGREKEWKHLIQAWRSAISNRGPKILFLCGEAGIGKTRLLEEMIQWVKHQGITNTNAICYQAEGQLAYAPIISWLRAQTLPPLSDVWLKEISRLFPEVLSQRQDLTKPGPLTEDWQREYLFEALSQAILGLRKPLLLTIDDLQWCDRDTLEWLHFLLRKARETRFFILCAYRPEEITVNHPLSILLQALSAEEMSVEINLPPLDLEATHTLATCIFGKDLDLEISQFLFTQSEGNPLFVVEMLRTGFLIKRMRQEDNTLSFSIDSKTKEENLPKRVHSLLKARIAQLSPQALELAYLAATIGREFDVSLLLKVSGLSEKVLVNRLDVLWQRRIVRERGSEAYDFSHDKLREVTYKNMSTARRRLLHHQIAEALEVVYKNDLDSVCHHLAIHYEKAGLPERSIPYCLLAAEMARKVYANQEARMLVNRGLDLLVSIKGKNSLDNSIIERLWEVKGDLSLLSIEYEKAHLAFQNALNHLSSFELINQARVYRKIAEIFREERKYEETLKACQQAETILGTHPTDDINRWWVEWIDVQIEKVWAYYWLAQWQELEALVDRIKLVVKVHASVISLMRFFMASCLMNLRKYRYVVSNEMLANSQESLAISKQYGSKQNQLECHFELGFLYLWRHEYDHASEYLLLALELAKNTGNMVFQTLCLTYMAVLYRFKGQIREVEKFSQQMEQTARTANMPDYLAAAKANQAWLAWRAGDFSTTEKLSKEALEIWQRSPMVYPCQWLALWPLIGVASKKERQDEAFTYVNALLTPTQQHFPATLNDMLEEVLKMHQVGNIQEAHVSLDQALDIALKMGYL